MRTLILFISISIVFSACSICYKYEGKSNYIVKKGKTFYFYQPEMEYFDVDYAYMEKLNTDSIVYIRKIFESSKGPTIKVKSINNDNLILSIKNKNKTELFIPTTQETSFTSNFFLPMKLFDACDLNNICSLCKYSSHYSNNYIYNYLKDTVITTFNNTFTCVLNTITLVDSTHFFDNYPIKLYLDKESGIPVKVCYPFCEFNELKPTNIKYNEINLTYSKKYFIFNKRYLW